MTTHERDYVLGTHDEELTRLGIQHRVWRARALEAWREAGFSVGHTLVDVGSGPGYASLDLAELAGAEGRVVAIDRSKRFLDALNARGRTNIETFEADLDVDELPDVNADGAWVRWVFAFVTKPQELLRRIHKLLKPGANLVIHEYFDYRTWRFSPRSPVFEEFVGTVMESWRANGGEPDVGLDLPRWLEDAGFTIKRLRPHVDVVTPESDIWQWPKTFIASGVERLVELGRMTPERGAEVRAEFARYEQLPHARLVTPAVLEIIATR